MTPETCPNCGEDVPSGARACPGCGADERTGWSDAAQVDRLDLPDDSEFDREGFVRREFGRGRSAAPWRRVWWWVAVVVLLVWLSWWWG